MSSGDFNTIQLSNFPLEIQRIIRRSKGVPEEFVEANIRTLGRMSSASKKPFFNTLAKKRGPHVLPPVVEEEILEYLGVRRGQKPNNIVKTVKNIRKRANENRKRVEREKKLKEQWAPIASLYEEAMSKQKERESTNAIRLSRKKQVEKSRRRRGKTENKKQNNTRNNTRNNRNRNNNFNNYISNNNIEIDPNLI